MITLKYLIYNYFVAEIVPFDGSPLSKVVTVPLAAIIPIYTMATVGIIFAIICFLFTLIFRRRK